MKRGFASVGTVNTFCAAAASSILCFALASCAVPVAPTGGSADATPPEITETDPAEGTTSFGGSQLRITFSEYVNEASFARAFAISPELEQPVDISWRRRTVTLRFRSPLRENTTYRVTVDKSLRDANGVSLSSPIVFAFSTGPEINRARLVGLVRRGPTGAGAGDMDIYAYDAAYDSLATNAAIEPSNASEAPPVLPDRPLYRTQTNSQGTFELAYLAAGEYFVVGITDQNANRQPDDGEWVAIPSMRSARASTTAPDSLLLTGFVFDQTAPAIRRARAISASRIEIRYSEPVTLPLSDVAMPSADGWFLSDSAGTRAHEVSRLHVSANDPSAVLLETSVGDTSGFLRTLRLVTGVVRDSSGNASAVDTVFIAPSSVADTSVARLVGVSPASQPPDTVVALAPAEWPVVELGAPRAPIEWLRVTARADNGLLRELPFSSRTRDGRSYEIEPGLADPTRPFALAIDRVELDSVRPADTTSTYWFRKLRAGELGGLIAHVDAGSNAARVEYFSADDPTRVAVAKLSDSLTYTATELRPGSYGVRAYVDLDGDGRWTPGMIRPYRVGEPITWVADSVEVRARFDTVLPDTLRIE